MNDAQDELAVRALAASYSDAVNRRDAEGMAAVFAPDGIIEKPGFGDPVQGVDKILKRYQRLQAGRDFLFQMTHSGLVEVKGDRAFARWWFTELKKPVDADEWLLIFGIYQDEAVKLDIGWRYAKRSQTTILDKQLSDEGFAMSDLPPFIKLNFEAYLGGAL